MKLKNTDLLLQESEVRFRRLCDFLSTVSHEIRTPLSILKMGIENLEVSCVGKFEEDENEIIEVLKRNTERLERLISDMLLKVGKSSSQNSCLP